MYGKIILRNEAHPVPPSHPQPVRRPLLMLPAFLPSLHQPLPIAESSAKFPGPFSDNSENMRLRKAFRHLLIWWQTLQRSREARRLRRAISSLPPSPTALGWSMQKRLHRKLRLIPYLWYQINLVKRQVSTSKRNVLSGYFQEEARGKTFHHTHLWTNAPVLCLWKKAATGLCTNAPQQARF